MTRYRMYPSETQHETLLSHCASARFVWNLAVEQQSYYIPNPPVGCRTWLVTRS